MGHRKLAGIGARVAARGLMPARLVVALRRSRRPMPRMVAMFHVGRCGSQVLASCLAQNPQIAWGAELFEAVQDVYPAYRPGRAWARTTIELAALRRPARLFGFEVKAVHFASYTLGMSVSDFVQLSGELGVRDYILLRRRNLLRVIASSLLGHRDQAWRTQAPKAPRHQAPEPVRIDPADPWGNGAGSLVETLDIYSRYYEDLEQIIPPSQRLTLHYEDHIQHDPRVAYRLCCDFLALEAVPVQIALRRMNPQPLHELVSNFDQLREQLRETPYDWMLET